VHHLTKAYEAIIYTVSIQDIECPDEIGDLMKENTYIPGNIMQNSVGVLVVNTEEFHVCHCTTTVSKSTFPCNRHETECFSTALEH